MSEERSRLWHQGERLLNEVTAQKAPALRVHLRKHDISTAVIPGEGRLLGLEVIEVGRESVAVVLRRFD